MPTSAPNPTSPAPKRGFWGNFGLVFVKLGKGAVNVALWASAHPDVLQAVAAVAGAASK